ncbi:ABC transporter G family member 36 [Rhynchospora pubera]|uniref:ABC transporter G family member 36 n=1 Tax=Rhynchospora pubera TaxID=906938 RepID=A0AAV8C200_9POAL|nr:ABC transporter G family member 36 [Rhynchospora pubera]
MENLSSGEGLTTIGSLRRSGSLWRQSGDVFSRSSREEDDEEALRWAALEKLPTYNRVRRGILSSASGKINEVDVENLGPHEKRMLLERLVRVAEEDNERYLLRLKDRIDRVGIELPTIEVRYENLNIEALTHVGNRGLPTVLNSTLNTIESVANALHILPNRKMKMPILHDVSGIIKPCRMTLLLGPPGSGKTTLLLALAGKLGSALKVSGGVTYNGHEMNEFVPERTAAYISQHDLHMGELTVRETLAFSARFQGVGSRYDMLTELSRREKAANIKPDPDVDLMMKASAMGGQEANVVTDYIIKILGLDICADILVGNDMIRGISGGQRKRVTTGEMLVGPAKVLFMDEISTGLDSSTTFQIVNSIRQSIHILQGTALISLLQPAPETYDLFDDIILISDGQVVYHGPRDNVLEFFESMGFKCPDRKGVADFLQEVTSRKDQQQYWKRSDEPYQYVPVKKFADAFKSFHVGRAMADELAVPFDKSKSHPAALTTSKYGVSTMELLKAQIDREILLIKRNSFVYIYMFFQLSLVAFVEMTLFLRTRRHHDVPTDGTNVLGSLFFGFVMIMFNGFSELAMTIMKLPVFFKQRDLRFFPAWTYTIPGWIVKIPISCLQVLLWVSMTYYVIGYDPNVGRLFKQYLLLLLANQMAGGLFRFIGGLARNMVIANTFGSFSLLVMLVLGGFLLTRDSIKKWWTWGYWISPLMYVQNAIAVNEFMGHSWDKVVNGTRIGTTFLNSRAIFAEPRWYWIGIGAVIGFIFLFNILFTSALTFLEPFGQEQPTISEETLKEKHANLTGEIPEGSSRGKRSSSQHRSFRHGSSIRNTGSLSKSAHEILGSDKKGMVLPFTPLSLTFDDIKYSVDMPQEMKAQGMTEDRLVLLKGISGSFRPGVLTALMGVSGAGKTTLMDVLAGRKTGGYIEGSINISGYPKKQETFARISGYCEQFDIHSPQVTVYESLVFSAWLRLSPDVDSETRKMFVEEVMELVELNPLRDSIVGLPGVNGLSTEQRKRLTIAVELVANPSIIFMDEPTSGLDARAAAIVMRTVRNTVNTGRTVVCTIHQPSIDIFEAFDELFLLKRGGEEIYAGPLGHNSSELIEYFEAVPGVPKIKDGYNPATWMLEVTTGAQEEALGVDFSQLYKNSDLYKRNKTLIRDLSVPPPESIDLYFPTQYSQPFFTQCIACLWKQNLSYWRNPSYTAVRFFFTLICGLLLGSIFWQLGRKTKTQVDLLNSMGSMYIATLFLGIQNTTTVMPVVSVERTVFYRERAAGMYAALPYAFGQTVIELPYVLAQALAYGVAVYAMIGFEWTVAKFLWCLYFSYLTFLYFTFYGMMCVGVTPNYQVASIISSAFFGLWNLFSGFLIARPQIPGWWIWYYWLSPMAWTLYGLVVSQYGDITSQMDDGVIVKDYVNSYFGFKHDFLPVVAVVTLGFTVLFAFLFGFSIQKLNFQKR